MYWVPSLIGAKATAVAGSSSLSTPDTFHRLCVSSLGCHIHTFVADKHRITQTVVEKILTLLSLDTVTNESPSGAQEQSQMIRV